MWALLHVSNSEGMYNIVRSFKSLDYGSSDLRFSEAVPRGIHSYIWDEPWISFDNIIAPKQAVHLLDNSVKLSMNFQKYAHNFDISYSKHSFIHWAVGEGLESGEMSEARENIAALIIDYRDFWYHSNCWGWDLGEGEEGEEE